MSNTATSENLPRLAYTVGETAKLLGVSVATIYRMVENGSLPYKRIDGRGKSGRGGILIPAAALNRWLSNADEPRQVAMERKAKEIAKGAVAKLRGGR